MIKKWKRRNSRKAQKLYCKIRKRHESFNVQWLLCATSYNVKNLCILPTYVFTCFVWLSSQSVIISLYSIIRLIFVMKTDCVFYAGWIEYFNIRLKSFKFWNNKYIKIGYIFQYFYEENSTKTVIPAHTGLYCIKTVIPAHTGLYCIKTVIPAHTGLYSIKYNLIIIQFRDNGYRVSFPGVKRPGRGLEHPPHLVPGLKKE